MNNGNVMEQLENVPFLGHAKVKHLEFLIENGDRFTKATIEVGENMTTLCIRTDEEGIETLLDNIGHTIGQNQQPDFHWTRGAEMLYVWAKEGKLELVKEELLKGRCAKNLFQRIVN